MTAPPTLTPAGRYPGVLLRILFRRNGLADVLPTERGMRLLRLTYETSAPDGRVVPASGLVALPTGSRPWRGLVAWQHGTASLRTAAPSAKDPVNGLLPAAAFAGHGYLLVAPDYLGFGVSREPHPYYLADHVGRVVRDAIVAARRALGERGVAVPVDLFLAGFSEGGHATLAAQRVIEAEPIDGAAVAGVAPVAGPVDLVDAGLDGALAGGSRFCSLYLAWFALTYARHRGRPLSEVVRSEWVPVVETHFDGEHDADATVAALPADPHALLCPEVVAARAGGRAHWFLDELARNALVDWAPRAPVRAYYGALDADVTPDQAATLERAYRARGCDARAVCVGEVDHDGTLVQAAPALRAWFDDLAAAGASGS